MDAKMMNRILLIIGFLTVLFLFRDSATAAAVPDLKIWGFVVKFANLWFTNILTFAITLFLFAFASIGFAEKWSTVTGIVFYILSVLLIPLYFLGLFILAFLDFQNKNLAYFQFAASIVALGLVIGIIAYFTRKK